MLQNCLNIVSMKVFLYLKILGMIPTRACFAQVLTSRVSTNLLLILCALCMATHGQGKLHYQNIAMGHC